VRPALASTSQILRWQHSEALRREVKPIHEHKSLPDGMEGLIDGIDDLNESLVFSSTKMGEVLQNKENERRELHGATKDVHPIVFVTEDNTVFEAIKMMTENKIGAVLVRPSASASSVNEYVGILTERDYMTKVALNGFDSRKTKVERIMTRNPVTVRADETCLVGLKKMTKGRFRHIPVTQGGKIIGILSLGDLVKNLLSSFKDSVDYLSEYIGGTGVAGKDEQLLVNHQIHTHHLTVNKNQ
jgi:CBS domain-containing protein